MLRAAGERPLVRVPHCLNHPPKMSRSRTPTPRGHPGYNGCAERYWLRPGYDARIEMATLSQRALISWL